MSVQKRTMEYGFGLLDRMNIAKRLARVPFFPLLIAVSFLVGWNIPAFYEWTGSNQSRAAPLVGQTALGLTTSALIVWLALPWLPLEDPSGGSDRSPVVRFRIRTLLSMTAVLAVVIAALIKFPMWVSGGLCAIACCYVVRFWILNPHDRWQTAALLACMSFPFVWIIGYSELDDLLPEILWIASALPAFFPACLIAYLAGQNPNDMMWLAVLLTGVEIYIGVWMIRLGPRRALAYLVLVLLMSTFGSFGLNALVRA